MNNDVTGKEINKSECVGDELLIFPKTTYEIILKQENGAELWSLYSFYYYTAKWQKTDCTKATTSYTAKGLGWTEDKVRKHKKQLISLGLIEDMQKRSGDNTKIAGHYIKIKYVMWTNLHSENPRGLEIKTVDERETNALNTINRNALNTGKEMLTPVFPKKKEYTPEFLTFWELYPKKENKVDAFKCYQRRIKEGVTPEMILNHTKGYSRKLEAEQTELRYTKNPSTFLNQIDFTELPHYRISISTSKKPDNYLAPSDPDKYDNIQEKQALRRKRLAEEEQRRNGQNVFGTLPA